MGPSEKRSARERFGGDWHWKLADGQQLTISEAIQGEGPGEGFAMLPWALDRYERVMRLRPGEAWLLKRLLAHSWEYGSEAFLSLRRITYESSVSRSTLQAWMTRLEQLGYVRCLSDGTRIDKRWRYDPSGAYGALALCIAADPSSRWAQMNGGAVPIAEIRPKAFSGPNGQGDPVRFDLDFEALAALAARMGQDLEVSEDTGARRRPTRTYEQLGGDAAADALAQATGANCNQHWQRRQREVTLMSDLEPPFTPESIFEHYCKHDGDDSGIPSRRKTWWYREDPRGRKGARPTISAIRETWGKWLH